MCIFFPLISNLLGWGFDFEARTHASWACWSNLLDNGFFTKWIGLSTRQKGYGKFFFNLASEKSGQELHPMVKVFSNAFKELWDRSVYFYFIFQLGKGVARDFFFMFWDECWHWSFILEILQISQNLVWIAGPT